MTQYNVKSKLVIPLKLVLFSFLVISTIFTAKSQTITKKIDTWYVYKEGQSSFKDLEPFKDILKSISIFGNPPKSFIEECQRNKIEVFCGVSDKEQAIDSPEKIKAVAEEYLTICKTQGYDGIDLDYEALDPQFQDMYSAFLKEVSMKLHNEGKKLSQCVGFYDSLYQGKLENMFYDVKVVAATCDLVRVMCYDMYFAPGRQDPALLSRVDCQGIGPTSIYPFVKEAMKFWAKHVPVNKLVMGLPAYSNDYEMVDGGKGQQIYGSIPVSVKGDLSSPAWLWFEKVNLYVYTDTNDHTHLFYASDEKSTDALLDLATDLQITNIGFWHFSTVSPEMWKVMRKWIQTE